MQAHVSSLFRFPVKSMMGESCNSLQIGPLRQGDLARIEGFEHHQTFGVTELDHDLSDVAA